MNTINWQEYEVVKIDNFPPNTQVGAIEIKKEYDPYYKGDPENVTL